MKLQSFGRAVNVTLGLPIMDVRRSRHGVRYRGVTPTRASGRAIYGGVYLWRFKSASTIILTRPGSPPTGSTGLRFARSQ